MASGKMSAVQHRLLSEIRPLDLFFKCHGVFLSRPAGPAWRVCLAELWSSVGLLINVTSAANVVKHFAIPALVSVFAPGKGVSQMTSFNAFLAHVTPIVFGVPMQIAVLLTLRKSLTLFCSALAPLDDQLNRPNFAVTLKYAAILRVALITVAVGIHSGFTLAWEAFHPLRPPHWPDAIRKTMSAAENVVFSLIPVVFFSTFGEILSFYQGAISRTLSDHLTTDRCPFNFTLHSIKLIRILNEAALVLQKRLGLLLFLTSGLSTVSIIITSYYFIVMTQKKVTIFLLWNLFQMMLHTARLISICRVADHIRKMPNKYVPILRKLRDDQHKLTRIQRVQITLFIIEITKMTSPNRSARVLGTLELSRNFILKAVYAVSNFIVIMYQFKLIEKR